MTLPVHVRMFPDEIAAVNACAAELSQQSAGAAFSRAEALQIAALEWRKDRQARQARGAPAPPPRAPAAAPALEAEAASASPAPGPGGPRLPPRHPVVRGRAWRPSRPRGRRGS